MITMAELEKLPESVKREILDYAEYLAGKYRGRKRASAGKWIPHIDRANAGGGTASGTVIKMREEERW
jgi:hypothetical protein